MTPQRKTTLGSLTATILTGIFLLNCGRDSGNEVLEQRTISILLDTNQTSTFVQRHARIKYVDRDLIARVIHFVPGQWTVEISTAEEYVDIAYQDDYQVTQQFLTRAGDVIQLSLDSQGSLVISSHTNNLQNPLYEAQQLVHRNDAGRRPLDDFYYVERVATNASSLGDDMPLKEMLRVLRKTALDHLEIEQKKVDSMRRQELIPEDVGNYLRVRSAFNVRKLRLFDDEHLCLEDQARVKELLSVETYRRVVGDPDLSTTDLLRFTFYDDFLTRYVDFLEGEMVHSYNLTKSLDVLTGVSPDSLVIKSLLLKVLDNSLSEMPTASRRDVLSGFRKISNNKAWADYLTQKHGVKPILKGLVVKDRHLIPVPSDLLLQRYRGKMIYVHFWSMECSACVFDLAASEAIQDTVGNDLIVLFIAVDQSVCRWRHVEKSHIVRYSDQSFYADSTGLNSMEQTFGPLILPHYMLYDREGKLVHDNAPGPRTEELKELIRSIS